MIQKIWSVFFSPTGGTKAIVTCIAGNLAKTLSLPHEVIDFTRPSAREQVYTFTENDLVIFGTPVYAGRIPNKILPEVNRLFEGAGTPVIPIAVFGNRSFDEALMEQKLVLESHGFIPIAAAAIVNEHVLSHQVGTDRPDAADFAEIDDFTHEVIALLQASQETPAPHDTIRPITDLPGHDPVGPYYRPLEADGQPANFLKSKPATITEKCTDCGICANVCPLGSVDSTDFSVVTGVCIKCSACVKACPTGAKYFDHPSLLSHIQYLEDHYQRRAANFFAVSPK